MNVTDNELFMMRSPSKKGDEKENGTPGGRGVGTGGYRPATCLTEGLSIFGTHDGGIPSHRGEV